MLLTIAPFGEFTKLFQVLLLIVLPVLAFTLLTTVLLHYGRRRKKEKNQAEEAMHGYVAGSSPENFCYKTPDGQLIYLDHTGLLKEYRNKLSYSHARYAALQQDFKKLESGLSSSLYSDPIPFNHPKRIIMEHTNMQTLSSIENKPAENPVLNADLNENEYLNDLLAEKKKQIEFLQNQVDLRIKSYHYAEKEKEEIRMKLEQAEQIRHKTVEEFESFKKSQVHYQQEVEHLQASLDEKTGRLTETEQLLKAKQDQVVYMENVLQEIKEQNQLLNASAADANDKNRILQQQLQTEETKAEAAEQKLLANKRLLQRLYQEFSACIQEETEEPPVIALRPDYVNNEWEETAAQ